MQDGCLNHVDSVAASTKVAELAEELQRRSLLLYESFVSARGVDFGRMRGSAALAGALSCPLHICLEGPA